jgi:hypothetical protein
VAAIYIWLIVIVIEMEGLVTYHVLWVTSLKCSQSVLYVFLLLEAFECLFSLGIPVTGNMSEACSREMVEACCSSSSMWESRAKTCKA